MSAFSKCEVITEILCDNDYDAIEKEEERLLQIVAIKEPANAEGEMHPVRTFRNL